MHVYVAAMFLITSLFSMIVKNPEVVVTHHFWQTDQRKPRSTSSAFASKSFCHSGATSTSQSSWA